MFPLDAATLNKNESTNFLCEDDSDEMIDEYETASTSNTSYSTSLLEIEEARAINKTLLKNNKRVLQSRNDNVLHVKSKKNATVIICY